MLLNVQRRTASLTAREAETCEHKQALSVYASVLALAFLDLTSLAQTVSIWVILYLLQFVIAV